MAGFWEKIRKSAKLAGIVGVAAANVALSYCSSTTVKVDGSTADAHQDAAVDASSDGALPDASVDGKPGDLLEDSLEDSRDSKPKPDKLWDVLCE